MDFSPPVIPLPAVLKRFYDVVEAKTNGNLRQVFRLFNLIRSSAEDETRII